ncbi:phage GP46 family protein [Pectobacterium aroidearum]|uniref:phage GP46 family protein n=1 Tax=Pectobacterium aroidearum TaxID=1201031 RepID=UPI002A820DC4|nr:phage GP46 family protein [Pectobacterium aroidearum]MDY4388558.1 phage GP46 family protein [Pectobacterium aroidearum]
MDNLLNPTTGDYTGTTTTTLANAVYLRLMTPLGSYWADPALGSRLHLLAREKDVARVHKLAQQYAAAALQPIVDDGRASVIAVSVSAGEPGWVVLLVDVTTAAQQTQTFRHPVRVS